MSGAASSSTIPRSHVSPQNLVNQRPTMALFSSSLNMLSPLASSSHLTIGSIDAMDFGAETFGLPPDFRPHCKAESGGVLRPEKQHVRKRVDVYTIYDVGEAALTRRRCRISRRGCRASVPCRPGFPECRCRGRR